MACAAIVHAGNDEAILIGSQASMTGGAVTAIVDDGTAAWYNPAGLAHVTRNSLDATGSVYGFNLNTAKGLVRIPNGNRTDASFTDWLLVPSALSFARRVSDSLVASFGIFVPRASDYDFRTSLRSPLARWAVQVRRLRTEYDYTLSLAGRTSPAFRWGVSLYGIYTFDSSLLLIAAGSPGQVGAPQANITQTGTFSDYGLRASAGFQADLGRRVTIGASVSSPVFTGFRSAGRTNIRSLVPIDTTQSTFEMSQKSGVEGVWRFTSPARLRFGVAIALGPHRLLLDGDVATAINVPNDDGRLDRRWNGNARLGALFAVSDAFDIGAGLFTDHGATKTNSVDYYGLAFGVRWASDYTTQGGRPLTFSTTLGGRYAYGFGKVTGGRFESDGTDLQVELVPVDFSGHELAANLAGGVSF